MATVPAVPWIRAAPLLIVSVVAAGCLAARPGPPWSRMIDLSHSFDADTIYWPTEEGFVLERGAAGVNASGSYYEAHRFRGAEHGGTHLDAPVHFAEGGAAVDALEPGDLSGAAVVVDVTRAAARDRDYLISRQDLLDWEREHGRLPARSVVLLRTGFARFWPDRERYLGTSLRGRAGVEALHFPGLAPDAAAWLAAERSIGAVGIDTASIDRGPSTAFRAHRILAAAGIPVFENLANLQGLPAAGFWIVALPMKIAQGSGAPLRIVAVLP